MSNKYVLETLGAVLTILVQFSVCSVVSTASSQTSISTSTRHNPTTTANQPTTTDNRPTPANITIIPDSVTNLHEINATPTKVQLSWDPPLHSVRSGFNVYVDRNSTYCLYGWYLVCHEADPVYIWDEPTCHTSSTGVVDCHQPIRYNVTNLISYTVYNFSVVTSNKGIISQPKSVSARTSVGVPGKVFNVQGYSPDRSSIFVTWTAPPHLAGPTNYSIKVYEADNRTASTQYTQIATYHTSGYENTSVLVTNLQSSWRYKMWVIALTTAGESPATMSDIVRTKPGTPGSVRNIRVSYVTDHYLALLVSWDCPLERERHGEITNYTVHYTGNGNNVSLSVTSGSYYPEDPCSESHKAYISVEPDVTYNITVKANAELTGDSSSVMFYADIAKMMYMISPPANQTKPVSHSNAVVAVSVTLGSTVLVLSIIIAALLLRR